MPTKTEEKPPEQALAPMTFTKNVGIELKTYDDLWRFANMVVRAGWAPKGMDKPESIMAAVQYGQELGITPMAAVQRIAVINGRPMIWGDMMLALCRAAECWDESGFSETETDDCASCTVRRKGGASVTKLFSTADATRAGLWGKQGPWTQYPARMRQMRARSFALRDTFSDVLMGVYSREEMVGAKDYGDYVDGEAAQSTPTSAELEASLSKSARTPFDPEKTNPLPPPAIEAPPEAAEVAPAPPSEPEAKADVPTKEDLVAFRVGIKNGYQQLDAPTRKVFKENVGISLIGDVEKIESAKELQSILDAVKSA